MSVLSLQQRVKKPNIDKSNFDRSFVHATTGKLGYLYPVLCEEILPSDYYKVKMSHIINMLPFAGKLQGRVDMFVHAFFVPMRILQQSFAPDSDTFEKIITGRSENTLEKENLNGATLNTESIGAYLGIPVQSYSADIYLSKMPKWAYMQIFNDYYRNKIIQTKLVDGDLNYYDPPLKRNWRRDYYTSATQFPQLGDPSRVNINIEYLNSSELWQNQTTQHMVDETVENKQGVLIGSGSMQTLIVKNIKDIDEIGVDVNDIRFAYAYQDWLVRMLQSGDDYKEHLMNVFGVDTSDGRIQHAEYLGGYSAPVIVNDVIQQSPVYAQDDETIISPLGTQGGTGYSYENSEFIDFYAEEHGFLMVIASMTPKTVYYGGLHKMFTRLTALDFFFPQFAYLPEQAISLGEVWLNPITASSNYQPFGYIERYAEYKHRNDMISGEFVKDFKHLHFARLFTTEQLLNETFIQCTPREDAFAVQGSIHWFGQFAFDIQASRPMPFNVDSLTI